MEIPGQGLEDLLESLKGRGERGGRDEFGKEKQQGSSEKKENGTIAVWRNVAKKQRHSKGGKKVSL